MFGPNPIAFQNVWLATAMSFGPTIVFAVIAAVASVRLGNRQPVMFAALWMTCALFYFFVDVRDHQDVYVGWRVGHLWFIATAAISGLALRWLGGLAAAMRRTAAVLLTFVVMAALPTTLIDIYNTQDIYNWNYAAGFTWTLVISPRSSKPSRGSRRTRR